MGSAGFLEILKGPIWASCNGMASVQTIKKGPAEWRGCNVNSRVEDYFSSGLMMFGLRLKTTCSASK